MSKLGEEVVRASREADVIWLAHPYPGHAFSYRQLGDPEFLEEIKAAGIKNLAVDLPGLYELAGIAWGGKAPTEAEIAQKISRMQSEQSTLDNSENPARPEDIARLMVNAKSAGVKLEFIDNASMYLIGDKYLRTFVEAEYDRNKQDATFLTGLFVTHDRATGRLLDPESFIGKHLAESMAFINRETQLVVQDKVRPLTGEGKTVVLFPSETLDGIRNFDRVLQEEAGLPSRRIDLESAAPALGQINGILPQESSPQLAFAKVTLPEWSPASEARVAVKLPDWPDNDGGNGQSDNSRQVESIKPVVFKPSGG